MAKILTRSAGTIPPPYDTPRFPRNQKSSSDFQVISKLPAVELTIMPFRGEVMHGSLQLSGSIETGISSRDSAPRETLITEYDSGQGGPSRRVWWGKRSDVFPVSISLGGISSKMRTLRFQQGDARKTRVCEVSSVGFKSTTNRFPGDSAPLMFPILCVADCDDGDAGMFAGLPRNCLRRPSGHVSSNPNSRPNGTL